MVLTSQSPQSTLRRQYMTRRRRTRRWPWIAAGIATAVVLTLLLWTGDSDQSPQQADAASAAETAQAPTPAPPRSAASQQARPRPRVADLPPPRSLESRPTLAAAPAPKRPAAAPAPAVSTPIRPAADNTTANGGASSGLYTQGMELLAEGKGIEARALLSKLLFDPQLRLRPSDAQTVRDALMSINEHLIFGKAINEADPLVDQYTVQPGDLLVKIAPQFHVTAAFIEQVNGVDPRRLHVGAKLKVVRGPFHARITKHQFRLDLYLKDDLGQPVFIWSMPVGLGEGDSTPVGNWVVKPGSKTINPSWANPRTGERFAADDPNNPIGEYWLALQGLDETNQHLAGYGIHGTIDPASIGSQQSMGCIRLREQDIEQVFNLMVPGQSTVQIVP